MPTLKKIILALFLGFVCVYPAKATIYGWETGSLTFQEVWVPAGISTNWVPVTITKDTFTTVTNQLSQSIIAAQAVTNGYGNIVYQNSNNLSVTTARISIATISSGTFTNLLVASNATVKIKDAVLNDEPITKLQMDYIQLLLQNQIDALADSVYYVYPTVAWQASSHGVYEKGSTITSVNLSFLVNKSMSDRTYSGGYVASLGSGTNYYLTLTTNISADVTYIITVTDSKTNSAYTYQTLSFINKKYYGVSANDPVLNPEILTFGSTWEAKGNSGTVALSGEYIYVIYPQRLGACTSFALGGFATTDWPYTLREVTNSSGYAETFYLYRSANKLTAGSIAYDIH